MKSIKSELKCRQNGVKDNSRALLLVNSGKEMIFHHLNISNHKKIDIELVERSSRKKKGLGDIILNIQKYGHLWGKNI